MQFFIVLKYVVKHVVNNDIVRIWWSTLFLKLSLMEMYSIFLYTWYGHSLAALVRTIKIKTSLTLLCKTTLDRFLTSNLSPISKFWLHYNFQHAKNKLKQKNCKTRVPGKTEWYLIWCNYFYCFINILSFLFYKLLLKLS